MWSYLVGCLACIFLESMSYVLKHKPNNFYSFHPGLPSCFTARFQCHMYMSSHNFPALDAENKVNGLCSMPKKFSAISEDLTAPPTIKFIICDYYYIFIYYILIPGIKERNEVFDFLEGFQLVSHCLSLSCCFHCHVTGHDNLQEMPQFQIIASEIMLWALFPWCL